MTDLHALFWFFFKLDGRAGRASFFLGGAFTLIVQTWFFYQVTRFPEGSAASQTWASALLIVVIIAAWCNFAMAAKRFHDMGKPTLLALISLVLGFILVIVMSLIKGDVGPNRYGPGPDRPQ